MSTGLLDYFVLEGNECVEQLDGLLARASDGAPDLHAFERNARALRGSATMAKVQGIATVGTALERVARRLGDGSLAWTPALRGAVVGAIDDLKILLRRVRDWGASDEARAAARAAELGALAPAPERAPSPTPVAAAASAAFLSFQTADVAAGLERFAAAPGPPEAFAPTLARIRSLRGVAALGDLPPLGEVIAAVDDAAKGLETGAATATDQIRDLFRAAAVVLREGSAAIRGEGRPNAGTRAVTAFTVAVQNLVESLGGDDRVVPIHTLFPEGGGDHVVRAEPNPPTTPGQRFTFEVVSHAEHLRRLVSEARRATDAPARQRVARELRGATRALAHAAESFGETDVAALLVARLDDAAALDPGALDALDAAATRLAPRIDELAAAAVPAPVRARTPYVTATPVRARAAIVETTVTAGRLATAPSGAELHELLDAGIQGLSSLGETPLAEPSDLDEDGVVPIQDLLFRGRAALRRAARIGESYRRSGTPPTADDLAELYDLLALADAE